MIGVSITVINNWYKIEFNCIQRLSHVLSSTHNNEDSEFNRGFDALDCKRIFAAIDYDLKSARLESFLKDVLLPKKDLVLFALQRKNIDNSYLDPVLSKLKKKWKRFDRFSFAYMIYVIDRSWKVCSNKHLYVFILFVI